MMADLITTSTASSPLLHIQDSKTITAKSKSNFSSAFLFLPHEKRLAIRRVYAFFRTIDDVVDEEPNRVKQKELLEAWKREIKNTYQGITIVPLLKELKESIERFAIPLEYFLKLIEGCEMDMTKKRYQTFDELYQYCYRVASMVGLVCMKIFEYASPTSTQTAIDLGIALQLTNIIRDVGTDLEKGRLYLPLEDLRSFNLTEQEIVERKYSKDFTNLMLFQYERACHYYATSTKEFAHDHAHQLLAARIMAKVYRRLLEKIKNKNFPVLHSRIQFSFSEKIFLLASMVISHYGRRLKII